MAVNTYPDGFPKVPSEAVEFSYFLSENEKQEWREWLQTATPDQQDELVDILHSMWQDNQKNAVPESFANNIIQTPQSTTTQPPVNNFTQQPDFSAAPANNFAQAPQFNPQPIQQNFPQPVNNNFAQPPQFAPQPAPQFQGPAFPPANNFAQQPDFSAAPANNFAQAPQFNPQPIQQNFPQPVNNNFAQPPQFAPQPAPQFQGPAFPPANNFAQQPDFSAAPANNFAQAPQFNPQPEITDQGFNKVSTELEQKNQSFNDFADFQSLPETTIAPAPIKTISNPESAPAPAVTNTTPDFFKPEENFSSPSSKPDTEPFPGNFSQQEESLDKPKEEEQTVTTEEPIIEDEIDKRGFSLDTRGDAALSGSKATQAATDDDPFKYDEEPKRPETFELKEKKASSEINIESLVKDNKYTPNPILEDTSAIEDFVYRNADNEKAGFNNNEISKSVKSDPENEIDLPFVSASNTDSVETKKDEKKPESKADTYAFQADKKNQPKDQQNNNNKKQFKGANKSKKDDFVNFSKLKENDTSGLLGGIYQDYLETSDSNQKKLTLFLERVASVLSNYEQITGHLENSTSKMMEINDRVVDQAKEIQQLKNATQTATGSSLQEQIDDVRYDIDSLEKEFRSLKTETRRKQNETAEQLAALGADAYKSGGIMQKMELLKVDIMNIQKKIAEVMGVIPESNVARSEPVKSDQKATQKSVSQDYSNNQQNRLNRFDRRSRVQDIRKNNPQQNSSSQNNDYPQRDEQSQEPPTKTSNLDLRGIL